MPSIQLYGLPSAGKSTLAAAISFAFPAKIVRCTQTYFSIKECWRQDSLLLFYTIFNYTYFTFLFLFLAGAILDFRNYRVYYSGLVGMTINIVNCKRCLKDNPNKVVIFDECYLQRIYSLVGYGKLPIGPRIIRLLHYVGDKACDLSVHLSFREDFRTRLMRRGYTERMLQFCERDMNELIEKHKLLDGYLTSSANNSIVLDRIDDDICKLYILLQKHNLL